MTGHYTKNIKRDILILFVVNGWSLVDSSVKDPESSSGGRVFKGNPNPPIILNLVQQLF